MKQILLALAVLFVLTPGIYAQSNIEKELQALDQKIEIAIEKNDTATLNKLTDPDGFYTLGNPPRLLKKEELTRRSAARQAGTMGKEVESDVQTKVFAREVLRELTKRRTGKSVFLKADLRVFMRKSTGTGSELLVTVLLRLKSNNNIGSFTDRYRTSVQP